jgi:monofunctional biosynthetic peptidoglycan transglycosylase
VLKRLGLALVLAVAAWGAYQWLLWPDVSALAERNPETTAFIERQRKAAGGAEPDYRWVPYAEISVHLKQAVLVAEDIAFFDHRGFDTAEVRTAIRQALSEGRKLRGASTISQQLAKNLWLSSSRSPWRKVKEALLTAQLERRLSKRRILELYLNVVEFGSGIYGAEAAAQRYFNKPAARLGHRQAAQLAAGLPRPDQWHPGSESSAYARRVRVILGRMEDARWILKLL